MDRYEASTVFFFTQECHVSSQADCINQLEAPWGLVRTTVRDWPPAQYDYSYADDAGTQLYTGVYKKDAVNLEIFVVKIFS